MKSLFAWLIKEDSYTFIGKTEQSYRDKEGMSYSEIIKETIINQIVIR